MALITNKDGQRLLYRSGKLVYSLNFVQENCCCKVYLIIIIYNSNQQIDDNFQIRLNDNTIGFINNNNASCTGRMFVENAEVTLANLAPGIIGCGVPNFEATVAFDPALLLRLPRLNVMSISKTQDNGNNNFGTVLISKVKLNTATGKFDLTGPVFNSVYQFASGVGLGQNYVFGYEP